MNTATTMRNVKGRVLAEAKKFVKIAGYLWVVLSLFEIHKLVVLRQHDLDAQFGFTMGANLINALVLGKVVLTGDSLHLADRFKHKALIYPVLFKAAVFSVLLICFNIVEEVLKGILLHGRSVTQSIPQTGGGGLEGQILVGTIFFVVLIPLFAFTELRRVLGEDELHSLLFDDRTKAGATDSGTR